MEYAIYKNKYLDLTGFLIFLFNKDKIELAQIRIVISLFFEEINYEIVLKY